MSGDWTDSRVTRKPRANRSGCRASVLSAQIRDACHDWPGRTLAGQLYGPHARHQGEKFHGGFDALLPLLVVTPSSFLALWHGKAPGSEFRTSTRRPRHMESFLMASASRFVIFIHGCRGCWCADNLSTESYSAACHGKVAPLVCRRARARSAALEPSECLDATILRVGSLLCMFRSIRHACGREKNPRAVCRECKGRKVSCSVTSTLQHSVLISGVKLHTPKFLSRVPMSE